ncbi:C3 and PZP-like alpha-2-macroglobulin domain-containing protein 8 [Mizuhopecten yessoensis]|nr:C3 and PZP-like alpha-2-macroglobulin domain-containing protein 8 [Mizuhopecten yessoensis]
MDAAIGCFLWWMLLLTKCHCEDVELSTLGSQYTLLTKYGYVFTPSPQANFITFQVKACEGAHIGLFQSEDDLMNGYIVVIGAYINTRAMIHNRRGISLVSHTEDGVISCDEYRYFWISWRNDGEVVLGRGEVVFQDVLLTLRDDEYLYQVRFVGITTGSGPSGKWKLPRLRAQRWQVLPMFKNIVMTSGIEWTVEANNPGACAIKCRQHPLCVSFIFNAERQYCQGHNQHFKNVAEGQGHGEMGSHYFTRA